MYACSPGQMNAHMVDMQMDPAPEAKAGSEDPGKVWVPQEAAMKDISTTVEKKSDKKSEDEENVISEQDMISVIHDKSGVKRQYVPPSYFERGSFCMLELKGLEKIPLASGFTLSCHTQSGQWHARWMREPPGSTQNFAPTWGIQRSELKALCMALVQLWDWYLSVHDDTEGKEHLKRLREYTDEILF